MFDEERFRFFQRKVYNPCRYLCLQALRFNHANVSKLAKLAMTDERALNSRLFDERTNAVPSLRKFFSKELIVEFALVQLCRAVFDRIHYASKYYSVGAEADIDTSDPMFAIIIEALAPNSIISDKASHFLVKVSFFHFCGFSPVVPNVCSISGALSCGAFCDSYCLSSEQLSLLKVASQLGNWSWAEWAKCQFRGE